MAFQQLAYDQSAPAYTLREGEVHVWLARTPRDSATLRYLHDTLSSDERARSDRFHFAEDRAEFVGARGVLRRLLSRYLNIEPAAVQFTYPCVCGSSLCTLTHRKPALTDTLRSNGLSFNVSHSHGVAAYAFCLEREVGIDIEFIRAAVALEGLEGQYLSCRESEAVRRLPIELQSSAFFKYWTRREAALKARGWGFARHQDTSLDHAGFLRNFASEPGYASALAVEGIDDVTLRCSNWNDFDTFEGS